MGWAHVLAELSDSDRDGFTQALRIDIDAMKYALGMREGDAAING
jgi:hypothetical protein